MASSIYHEYIISWLAMIRGNGKLSRVNASIWCLAIANAGPSQRFSTSRFWRYSASALSLYVPFGHLGIIMWAFISIQFDTIAKSSSEYWGCYKSTLSIQAENTKRRFYSHGDTRLVMKSWLWCSVLALLQRTLLWKRTPNAVMSDISLRLHTL